MAGFTFPSHDGGVQSTISPQPAIFARNVKSHAFDGYALLPALHARLGLYTHLRESLSLVESLYIMVSQDDGLPKGGVNKSLCLVHLLLGNGQLLQHCLVKLQLVFLHGLVATCFHIVEHSLHG